MPKAKATETTRKKGFRELSEVELNKLSEEDRRIYNKKLAEHQTRKKRKQAIENAGKYVSKRLDMLEHVLKTTVEKKGDISCDLIDATFLSPCKRTMFATENRLVKFFDEGDLIQINCHTVPTEKIPCVVIKNGVLYFAQKKDSVSSEYANLDSYCTEENATLMISEDEYIGDIVNIIKSPRNLFEPAKKEEKEAEAKK